MNLTIKTQGEQKKIVRQKFWQSCKKAAGKIPFMEDVVAAYYCAFDPKTPKKVRAILLAALAYFVMPFDAIPDMLAGLGFTDDITVLTLAIKTVHDHIKEHHRQSARAALNKHDNHKI